MYLVQGTVHSCLCVFPNQHTMRFEGVRKAMLATVFIERDQLHWFQSRSASVICESSFRALRSFVTLSLRGYTYHRQENGLYVLFTENLS